MENSALKCKHSTDQLLAWCDLSSCNGKIDAEYLVSVSKWVSKYRHEGLDLQNPVGATLRVGPLEDTIYRENDDEVNGWGKFYLPDIVNMQVVGVVEGTSCPCDQLVLMTCEDRNIYAYDGEELHLVASSPDQLRSDGIEFPASKTYYDGEAFKDMTEEDWAEVRKGPVGRKLDEEDQKWVKENKSRILKNLQLGREKQRCHQELGGGPLDDNMLSTLLSTHQSAHTEEHANSTQTDPRLQFEPRSCDTTVPFPSTSDDTDRTEYYVRSFLCPLSHSLRRHPLVGSHRAEGIFEYLSLINFQSPETAIRASPSTCEYPTLCKTAVKV